jgi:hypothetical protein
MFGDSSEVGIGCQHDELILDTKLRQKRIDGADLDSAAAAFVSQPRGGDVIFPGRDEECQGLEGVKDLRSIFWPLKTLKHFLKDQTRGENRAAALEELREVLDFSRTRGSIAAQGEGPDAGVDEEVHFLERSFL